MLAQLPTDYAPFLRDLKTKIRKAQAQAALKVNLELVSLYWEIGAEILQRQVSEGWGTKVIDRLSSDLRNAFPDMKGFSPRNLKYMKDFAAAFPGPAILQQPAAKLPWTHLCILLDRIKDPDERAWYVQATLENGWSRDSLTLQIRNRLHERQVKTKKANNFADHLPPPQSELAEQALKDPYVLTSLPTAKLPLRGGWSRVWWSTLPSFFWNWAPALRLLAARSTWRWKGKTFSWICFSTT